MRKLVSVLSAGACLVVVGGCGNGAADSPTATTVTTVTESVVDSPAEAPQADAPQQAEPAPPQGAQGQWAMPNLVGSNLQDAQNQIQSLTSDAIFYTASHDLSGSNRNQVLDANWEVCSQNVPPGTTITPDSTIDFGVVKIGEGCP